VLAFEVGYLGYAVPGRVDDLLGIVSPGLQPCLRGDDPEPVLAALHPDYVVIVDNEHYVGTGCIQRSVYLRQELAPHFALPRPGNGRYVVYARRDPAH